ncbi:heme-binding protein [Nocardia sp. NPDC057455]|uniref:GlcG/HbpS family heme-binding protein n=1 Tax=Nocardia sp. NPDC057455 TaxID=3346138 RepID=UPI003670822A
MTISLERADSVVAAARRAAADRGETVTIAVVDAAGDLIAFARMPGAALPTIESAQHKAAAAIALGFDTIQMAPLNDPGHLLPGAVSAGNPLVPHGGGVLIREDGVVIGALGVSGATTPIVDHKIASAAAPSG